MMLDAIHKIGKKNNMSEELNKDFKDNNYYL